eukprot:gnl/TRDRNA2_/TRDRNA2_177727_c1_seq7.p1 gnl/TRDRNA2_/TRDRNA2_177727_c1~~gnl/TRDRNA2_/TRDRNA2_177727_c1_seq7.p1  ORF type:complete len:474 (-),score=24.33 gnl/TRDRNA2_/TRDRNA2_177727_c1_seq7:184-1605(-)
MHLCASMSLALFLARTLMVDEAHSLRLPDGKPVHRPPKILKRVHPTKRQRQALPSRHETFVNQTALTDQQRMDCEPHGDDQVSNMIAHVKQYFNDQSPPPLGDGLSPWQLTLVQSMRFGSVEVGSKHRSVMQVREPQSIVDDPQFSVANQSSLHAEHLAPDEHLAPEIAHDEHLAPDHAHDTHVSANYSVMEMEKAYRSVSPEDWIRVIKTAFDNIGRLPVEDMLRPPDDHLLSKEFAGDSDLDFAVLGDVSDDQMSIKMREFEKLLTSNGHPAVMMPALPLKIFQSSIIENGQHGADVSWTLPDRWIAVLTEKRSSIGVKFDRELVPRVWKSVFNHAFHNELAGQTLANGLRDAWAVVTPHMVILDIWNPKMAFPFKHVPRHPTRKVLLEGSTFPWPQDWDTKYFTQLTHLIAHVPHGDKNVENNVHSACDLYLPKGFWPDDIEATKETESLVRTCAGQLRSRGVFSFADVC